MPNWTYNKVTCKKSIGDKILEKKDGDYYLDFNKLVPMSESLDLTAGSIENKSIASYYISLSKDEQTVIEDLLEKSKIFFYGNYLKKYKCTIDYYLDHNPELEDIRKKFEGIVLESGKKISSLNDLGKYYIENIKNYGYSQWYDWRCEKWGTKWNVEEDVDVFYDELDDEYTISFKTAWSCPYGIIEEYSKLCGDDEFNWEYIDEDYDGHHYLSKENGIIKHISINREKEMEI